MSRQRALTPEQRERAFELGIAGVSRRAISQELGVSRRQLSKLFDAPATPEPAPAPSVAPAAHVGVPAPVFPGGPAAFAPAAHEPQRADPERLAQEAREQAARFLATAQPLQAKRALDVAVLAEDAARAARAEKEAPASDGPRLEHLSDAELDEYCDLAERLERLARAAHEPGRVPAPPASQRPFRESPTDHFRERVTDEEKAKAGELEQRITWKLGELAELETQLDALIASTRGREPRVKRLRVAAE